MNSNCQKIWAILIYYNNLNGLENKFDILHHFLSGASSKFDVLKLLKRSLIKISKAL